MLKFMRISFVIIIIVIFKSIKPHLVEVIVSLMPRLLLDVQTLRISFIYDKKLIS